MRHDSHYVDALLAADSPLLIQEIDLDRIMPNPDQPRKDMGDLDGLARSIEEQGVLEPILVKSMGERFIIISGERRFQAGCKLGLDKIPCIIKDLDDNQVLEVALVENLQRKDLHPFEEADGLLALSRSFDYTHDEIAQKIGKSRSSVTETLTLATLEPEVREAALDAGITAKSMLLGVARLDAIDDQLAMIWQIARGAGREEVRRQAKKQTRAKPFVYKYRDPSKTFSVNLRFKKSEVEKAELIEALENVLADLRAD